ncbi:hypothetical protein AB205_0105160 [Aquarana catesbeiana]|nr:hypothetical protein AB205_0105160 [Aquarana catesbeiana]
MTGPSLHTVQRRTCQSAALPYGGSGDDGPQCPSSPDPIRKRMEKTITSLGVLTGAQLFSLTKDELKTVCPEGPRVYNQVTLQKATLEELSGNSELREIMKKRQEKINAAASDSGVESFDEGNNH